VVHSVAHLSAEPLLQRGDRRRPDRSHGPARASWSAPLRSSISPAMSEASRGGHEPSGPYRTVLLGHQRFALRRRQRLCSAWS